MLQNRYSAYYEELIAEVRRRVVAIIFRSSSTIFISQNAGTLFCNSIVLSLVTYSSSQCSQASIAGFADILVEHGGASGVAFLWEQQLLNTQVQAQ